MFLRVGGPLLGPPPPSLSLPFETFPQQHLIQLCSRRPVKERDGRRDVSHQRQRPRDISATMSLLASVPVSCCCSCGGGGGVGKHIQSQAAEWKRVLTRVEFSRVEMYRSARINTSEFIQRTMQQVPGCPSLETMEGVMEALTLEINV